MPRPKNTILHGLFDVNDFNLFVCNNGNCNGKVLSSHSSNLERHLKAVHPDLYTNYMQIKGVVKSEHSITKTKSVHRELNKANIALAIVELFVKNERPLGMIQDRAFKVLVQPAFDALHMRVNAHDVNETIMSFCEKLKSDIKADLEGKLLSLKIDVASMQDLSVLGIHAQYTKNKCLQIKTLAVKVLECSLTSEYLKAVILQVLQEYEIALNQILTITTDNEAHMLSTVNDLNEVWKTTLEAQSDMSSLTKGSVEYISANASACGITAVRCVAHALQLCAYDVLKEAEIEENLEKCRCVVKNLRTPSYLTTLQNYHYKEPIMDCATSWNSTYDMLESLLESRAIIDSLSSENAHLYLSAELWNFAKEFVKTFKSLYTATVKLQTEQLYFSELYVIIMDILFQVESLPTNEMTVLIVAALNRLKSELFESALFNAAIFLDPRIKICMDAEQTASAKNCITGLHKRINSLEETAAEYVTNSTTVENLDKPSTSNLTSPKSFSEFLQNLDTVKTESMSSSLSQLEADLLLYEKQSRLPLSSNIIDFWSTQNNSLSAIANIILAIPATKVSVKRLLSALKYILSNQCNTLIQFSLEDILMVKVNDICNYEN